MSIYSQFKSQLLLILKSVINKYIHKKQFVCVCGGGGSIFSSNAFIVVLFIYIVVKKLIRIAKVLIDTRFIDVFCSKAFQEPLSDLNSFFRFCISNPQQDIKYQLQYC